MKNMTIFGVVSAVFLLILANAAYSLQETFALRVHLPREVTIKDNDPNLGQVAIVQGDDAIKAKAIQIPLGHISSPGQSIIVDRSMLLSRLACNGIDASNVQITGAEKMTISREHQLIKGKEFVDAAAAFLKANLPNSSICQIDVVRIPDDLVFAGEGKDIKTSHTLTTAGMKNQGKVIVNISCNDKEIGIREVIFNFKYNCRKVAAKVDIAQGQIITEENVKLENDISSYPEPADWKVPYGFIAKRPLKAGTIITENMLTVAVPDVLLKRNQNVVIKIDKNGLLATAIGKALQPGSAGDIIKVINVDSNIIIAAKVMEDGTVEPIF